MSSVRTWLSLIALAVATPVITGCAMRTEPAAAPRYDKPQEAFDFERSQRLDWAGDVDPRAKYREAVAWSNQRESARSDDRISTSQWQELGPGNIGGRVRTLVIDPVNPRRMLLGGVSGGLWRSDDGGTSWRPTGDSLTNLAINSMALDPSNPLVVYAGTGEGYFREEVRGTDLPLRGGGIFVSRDFGDTWTFLESTGTSDFYWVNDLEISSLDSRRLYAATRSGVWRSTDSGTIWSRVLPSEAKGGCLDLAVRTGTGHDSLLASCGTLAPATVFANANAESDASTWVPVLAEEGMGRTSLAVARSAPDYVYALAARNAPDDTSRDQRLFALFRSDRGGAAGSWTAVARGDGANLQSTMLSNASLAPTCESGANPLYYVNMGWYTNALAVDPVDPMRVWVGGVDLFRSDDGGVSWGLASRNVHVDQHRIVFPPQYDGVSNRALYVTNDGGIYRTDDARAAVAGLQQLCAHETPAMSWTPLNTSLGVTQLYHGLAVQNSSTLLAGSQDNGFLRGGALGLNGWSEIAGGDVGYSAVDPANPKILYAMTGFGVLQKSTDGGMRFVGIASPPDDGFLFITPMLLDARSSSTLWIGGSRVWRSTNGGASWIATSNVLPDGIASSLATSPHDPALLFVGTSSGAIYRSGTARTAANENFEMTIPRRGFVTSIAVHPVNSDTVLATYSGFGGAHVWRSTDSGHTWSDIDGSGAGRLPDIPVHSIAVDSAGGDLYIATDLGVYASSDAGLSWNRAGIGLPRVVTKWLVISNAADGRRELVAFTHGRGAWRLPLPTTRRHAVRR